MSAHKKRKEMALLINPMDTMRDVREKVNTALLVLEKGGYVIKGASFIIEEGAILKKAVPKKKAQPAEKEAQP